MENPNSIIFIDDNPQDASLVKYALSQLDIAVQFSHYEDGPPFLADLDNIYAPNVACILVDVNMPQMKGFDVVTRIKSHPEFKHTPVVMFTSTNSNGEKIQAYASGANGYVSKPMEIEDIVKAMQAIVDFWVLTNERTL